MTSTNNNNNEMISLPDRIDNTIEWTGKKEKNKKGCKMKWKEENVIPKKNNNVIYHLFRDIKTVRTQQCFWLFCLLFPHCHSFHFGSTKWINNNKTKEESIKDTHQQTNKQTQNLWLYLFHLATVQKVFKSILCVTNKQTNKQPSILLLCYDKER